MSDILSGKFPMCPGRSFEKCWGLYSDRPRGRSFSLTKSVRETVSLGSFHQFAAVNLFGDNFSRTVGCVGFIVEMNP